jgi:Rrf2 family protein
MEIIRRNTEYGIRALLHLALHRQSMVTAGEIAEQQDVPIDFLQKILQKFVKAGMVDSYRGAQGGFSLAKEPQEISMLEVLEILQGKLAVNKCFLGENNGCPRSSECPLKYNWLQLQQKIEAFLKGITLQDLVDQWLGSDDPKGVEEKH